MKERKNLHVEKPVYKALKQLGLLILTKLYS